MLKAQRKQQPTEAELMSQILERLQEQMQQLTVAMQIIAGQRAPPLQNIVDGDNGEHDEENNEDNPFAGQIQHPIVLPKFDEHWEQGFKSELPEFHGGSTTELILDWIITVVEEC